METEGKEYLRDGNGEPAKSHTSENNENRGNRKKESSRRYLRLDVARHLGRSDNNAFLGVDSRTDDVALDGGRLLERLFGGLGLLGGGVESSTGRFRSKVEDPTRGIFRS